MKKLLLVLCCFPFFSLLQAQSELQIDSMITAYQDPATPDTLKVLALLDLSYYYEYKDLELAQKYLSKATVLAQGIEDQKWLISCYSSQAAIYYSKSQLDSTQFYYSKTLAYYESIGNKRKESSIRFNIAMAAFNEGDYERSKELLELNLAKNPTDYYGQNQQYIGRVLWAQGYMKLALEKTLAALEFYEQEQLPDRQAFALSQLGNIEAGLLNYTKAIEYYEQVAEICQELEEEYFLTEVYINLSMAYLELDDMENAQKHSLTALDLANKSNYAYFEGMAQEILGSIALRKKLFENAIDYYQTALTIHEQSNRLDRICIVNRYIGKAYLEANKARKAITYLNESLMLADSMQSNPFAKHAFELRANAFENLGQYDLALEDYKKFHQLNDTIYNEKKISEIEELRIIFDTEKKEQEIALLAKNAELDAVKKNRLWVTLGLVSVLGIMFVWMQNQQRRREKIMHQKEQEIQIEKNRVAELENQKLNHELDFKKQELTSKVLQLCRKNEFLQALDKEVKTFRSDSEGNEKNRLEKLSRKINRNMAVDLDWQEFLKSFETVHPDFNKLLLKKYPNLVPNEIRLACLMRMNLESKDIANLLNITPDGVKKARYRMRKKMQKDSTVNLTEYFINFGILEEKTA